MCDMWLRSHNFVTPKPQKKSVTLVFTTSVDAMVLHSHAHNSHDFIKVARKKDSDILRPEHHYLNRVTEKYMIQGDADLHRIIIPPARIDGRGRIACRKCNHYQTDTVDSTDAELPLKILSSLEKSLNTGLMRAPVSKYFFFAPSGVISIQFNSIIITLCKITCTWESQR